MLNYGEDIQTLTRLGLTIHQAEVYLTLAKMEKATIKTLSSISKIDRANLYRIITRLQELNLVEKFLANPTTFKALPVNEGIMLLLERREAEYSEVKAKVKELLKRHKQSSEAVPAEKECQFALIPSGKLTSRKVAEMIDSNLKTHEIIIFWKDFEDQIDHVVAMWTKVLLKGIKARVIVFLEEKEKLPKKIEEFTKYNQFEIRKTQAPPRATISIIDEKEAFLSVTPRLSPGNPGLWMSNPTIVGLIREYFELVWRNSEKLLP